jgi:hypothetical protein
VTSKTSKCLLGSGGAPIVETSNGVALPRGFARQSVIAIDGPLMDRATPNGAETPATVTGAGAGRAAHENRDGRGGHNQMTARQREL